MMRDSTVTHQAKPFNSASAGHAQQLCARLTEQLTAARGVFANGQDINVINRLISTLFGRRHSILLNLFGAIKMG